MHTPLSTDGNNYEVLYNSVTSLSDSVPGLIFEIGTRRGGSAKIIIDGLVNTHKYNRTFITCDPYGNIPYNYNPSGNQMAVRLDYTNQMRAETIPVLLEYAWKRATNMVFMNMEDSEYFKRFADGYPIYNEEKFVETKYAFVYYDGPHDVNSILFQTKFFTQRSSIGTRYVYDDHTWYEHRIIDNYLRENGFVQTELIGQKVSYVREK